VASALTTTLSAENDFAKFSFLDPFEQLFDPQIFPDRYGPKRRDAVRPFKEMIPSAKKRRFFFEGAKYRSVAQPHTM